MVKNNAKTAAPAPGLSVAEYAKKSYLAYAMSVISGRTIPCVEDGMKPVQRRILFAMKELGLDSTAKPKKSARVVGDVIGKYHPHGDTSVYDAMVAMAQSFKSRYPLVSGEGNFGDVDEPKSYAAMRYTEVKLSSVASALLGDLDKGVVDFIPNYDNTDNEPQVLPASLPFLFLCATPGIAVGMTTKFVPHQVDELVAATEYILEHKRVNLDTLLQIMPAPDFPTGGVITSTAETIRKIYETGSGSLTVRGCWRLEKKTSRKWDIHITELPPHVSPSKLLETIGAYVSQGSKAFPGGSTGAAVCRVVGGLKDISANGKMDLVIRPASSSVTPDSLMNTLCACTDIETNVQVNFTAVDTDGVAHLAPFVYWIRQWVSFRLATIKRRLENEIASIRKRLNIIYGRIIAVQSIEEVVRIVTKSSSPQKDLMDKLEMNEAQATDVLNMRVRSLSNMEMSKMTSEKSRREKRLSVATKTLASPASLRTLVKKDMRESAKLISDKRKTVIKEMPKASIDIALVKAHIKGNIFVATTKRGWIYWTLGGFGSEADAPAFKIKSGDSVIAKSFGYASDNVFLLNRAGKSFCLPGCATSSGLEGTPIGNVVSMQQTDVPGTLCSVGSLDDTFVIVNEAGYGMRVSGGSLATKLKAGRAVMANPEGSNLVLFENAAKKGLAVEDAIIVCISSSNRAVAFPVTDLREMKKGRGVGLMRLPGGDVLVAAAIVDKNAKGCATIGGVGKKAMKLHMSEINSALGSRSANKLGHRIKQAKNGKTK